MTDYDYYNQKLRKIRIILRLLLSKTYTRKLRQSYKNDKLTWSTENCSK